MASCTSKDAILCREGLVTGVLYKVFVTVECGLRDGQQIRVGVIRIDIGKASFVFQVVHHALHFVPAAQVEPTLSFEGQLHAALVLVGFPQSAFVGAYRLGKRFQVQKQQRTVLYF